MEWKISPAMLIAKEPLKRSREGFENVFDISKYFHKNKVYLHTLSREETTEYRS